MGGFRGGDPAEMQQMATEFTRQAEQVRNTMQVLDREANKVGTAWKGPGAERFRGAWQNYRGSFQRIAEELSEASRYINNSKTRIEASTE